ncbi:MAG: autotransporter domain-containing protein [Rhizomicrobium sp.]
MYKRALLLTAATVALMSGPAMAATDNTDIKTKVTTPVDTATAASGAPGNILIDTNGSVVVQSTTAAVTIDSSNIVTNKASISNTGTTGALGVQLDTGFTGAFDSTGAIDMSGSGLNKIGIEISNGTGGSSEVFTGTSALPSPNLAVTNPVAIYLEAGSTLNLAGDDGTGILVNPSAIVEGDITINGTLTLEATTATATTGGASVGVNLEGTLAQNPTTLVNSNFTVGTSGVISVTGANAQGVNVSGAISGYFANLGDIQALGTVTPAATTSSTKNPEAGSAITISNSIGGGFYNGGSSTDTTGRASIAESGESPALDFLITAGNTSDMHIGAVTDATLLQADANATGFGIINRGSIGAISLGPNISVTGLQLNGSNGYAINVDGGIFNAGTITATTTTDVNPIGSGVAAQGIVIGTNVTVPRIVNSNEENTASSAASSIISAQISGSTPGIATAIDILQDATVNEIDNQGTISASATTTDATIANLSAFAIRDQTSGGTLQTITNSGNIGAVVSTLNNGLQVASAIDLLDSTQNVTITNSGMISGSILLGTGNDTITDEGATPNTIASMNGDLNFGGGHDSLQIGQQGNASHPGVFTGAIQETAGGTVMVDIGPGSSLFLQNDGTDTNNGLNVTTNLPVSTMTLENGGTLGLTLAQAFNVNAPGVGPSGALAVIQSTGAIDIHTASATAQTPAMTLTFGSFITSTTSDPSQFVLMASPANMLTIDNVGEIQNEVAGSKVPFLFVGDICTYNVTGSLLPCSGTEPINNTDSELILNLTPKTVGTNPDQLPLTGYAAKMFPLANIALASDNALGAAVISAGSASNITTTAQGNALYQKIYSSFAPDVTGSQRALAVSLTDQSTGPVGARQRALRMYAGQDGDATMWGQEFTERLNVGTQTAAAGFNDSGFGFALGIDGGSPAAGRYGGAFTFYSGDTSEKTPRDTKTTSEWYMLTGYSDWRGKGLFVDSQLTVGYGSIDGKRYFNFDETSLRRIAEGKRAAAIAAGGVTAGVALTAGGTVIMPQLSIDALTMREEGYTETNGGVTTSQADDGFDLRVRQEYNNSVRGFLGLDMRQDLNFGEFFLQPEIRGGYRYDFLNAAQKLSAQFVCSTVAGSGCGDTSFNITGPDPAKANFVAGGSIAATTGAWSIGLNYDYIRGIGNGGGHDSVTQAGTITLIGRI